MYTTVIIFKLKRPMKYFKVIVHSYIGKCKDPKALHLNPLHCLITEKNMYGLHYK